MLVDRAIIHVHGGNGGDGCMSFRREKFIPKGGPDGGDGGDGGSVFLLASPGVDTLLDMAGRHHWRAEHGRMGMGKSMHGANGKDLEVRVPPGTLVYDADDDSLIVDLDQPGMRFEIARGGRGGFGNEHYKSATQQAPRRATPGAPGEKRTLRLELKLIADVGLVGKPNAGKSTLLSRCSAARPKIADYPFTTLEPQLGIAELTDRRRLVLADIPGLIEGASTGSGLGLDFLRHIERTRVLVHVLEAQPLDGTTPLANYQAIRRELAEHSAELAHKPEIVALNKVDLLSDAGAALVAELSQALACEVLAISAAAGTGIRELLERCWSAVKDASLI